MELAVRSCYVLSEIATTVTPMTSRMTVAIISAGLSGGVAFADGRATIESPTPEGVRAIEVAWGGQGRARFDVAQTGAYMLALDGTLYAVANAGGMGTTVMDLSSLPQMSANMPSQGGGDVGGDISIQRAEEVVSIEPTGRTETIAGMQGELHMVTWIDEADERHTDNAVLSDAPLALEIAAAFETLAETTSSSGEVDPRQRAVRDRGLAILRYADSYVVVSASEDGRPAGAFELPAEPTDLSAMMQGMGPNR